MAFSIPSDLRGIVLYWWKIIDRPQVVKDHLYNFIAFELYLTTLNKAKKMVEQAIKMGFLQEDDSMEYVSLTKDLQQELESWQIAGREKALKIQEQLEKDWLSDKKVTINQRYNALLVDLIDPAIFEKSGTMRASWIKLESTINDPKIQGTARDYDENDNKVVYPFQIDLSDKIIAHNCPDFINLRQSKKQLCDHLGRVIIKLFSSDPEKTVELLETIVHNKSQWRFDAKLA